MKRKGPHVMDSGSRPWPLHPAFRMDEEAEPVGRVQGVRVTGGQGQAQIPEPLVVHDGGDQGRADPPPPPRGSPVAVVTTSCSLTTAVSS